MSIELKVPTVGESITEVEIGEWLKGTGESAVQDETVVLIETDKVTLELAAPVTGTITKVLKSQGETATIGEVIGLMEEGAVAAPAAPAAAATPAAPAEPTTSKPAPPHVMPAAKRAAAAAGLDAAAVAGTGPGGRVLKEDIQRAATARPPDAGELEKVVPMSPLRRRIAERLVESQQTAALLTTFNEVDMSAVMRLRADHKEGFLKKHGVKLGFMSFFVKAAIEALREVPAVNAEIRDRSIVYRHHYDVGVAIGGGRGLVVPVLRRVEHMSFADIELAIADFAQRARGNKLELAELQGGTFTISNGGIYGSLLSTPIVNPPQSGILGMHTIQDRPVARDGQVVIRPMMYLALTYDHRIVDGREAVTFLIKLRDCLQDPARMLLEV